MVSSDFNPEETLGSKAPSCPCLGFNDRVSSMPTSHPQPDSHSQNTRGYGDLQLCLHDALSKETRPSLKA